MVTAYLLTAASIAIAMLVSYRATGEKADVVRIIATALLFPVIIVLLFVWAYRFLKNEDTGK